MALGSELSEAVEKFFKDRWTERVGQKVPEAGDVALGNEAVKLEDAVVLYADISASTKLVDGYTWSFAAEIYKAYLLCAARVIRSEGGVITAYDGDRIMAVYIGDSKNSCAARTGLKINYCRTELINPLIRKHYAQAQYELRHVVGIDRSVLHAARTGVRGANDLVWVGRAANHAAKLCNLSSEYSTYITDDVFQRLGDSVKTTKGQSMWKPQLWSAMNNRTIYGSTWQWSI